MKYLLVEVCERDISLPEVFATHEEAHNEMCKAVANIFDEDVAVVKESYLSGEEFDGQTCITEDQAWTERHGNNFDWKIFRLDAKCDIPDERLQKATQCLIDNGIESDEAQTVLKALGYILLDEEWFPADGG